VVALISVDAYSMIKERVIPFCTSPLGTQPVDPNARLATVPGTGQGINFVYTAAEARALPGRCKGIMALLAQLP
jgi:hypothetical protein